MNARFPLFSLDFVGFFRAWSRSLCVLDTEWTESLFRLVVSSSCLVISFNIYFCHRISYHLCSSEFSSFASSFSLALDRCCWKFLHHFNCNLFLQFLITSLLCKLTGPFCISLRSDCILCFLHIAPVNDLQSPIYNNQWKKLKMKKRKSNGKCL